MGTEANTIRGNIKRLVDDILREIAWRLPRRLVYYCAIRVQVHASAIYSTIPVPDLTVLDTLKAWDKKQK